MLENELNKHNAVVNRAVYSVKFEKKNNYRSLRACYMYENPKNQNNLKISLKRPIFPQIRQKTF